MCTYCNVEVSINLNSLQEHYMSSRHKNYETIYNLLLIFASYGMGWISRKKRFYCKECKEDFEAKAKILLQHIEGRKKISQAIIEGGEEDFGDMVLIVKTFKSKL